jgi:diguanylate cyclase (GGDEF)-like protein
MTDLPVPFRESARFLKRLLIGYWVGSSLLLTMASGVFDLVERHREVIYDAEHARDVVQAVLASPMTEQARQAAILAYASSPREDELDGMNVLLVVDPFGKIVYSSRSGWLGLSITDPQLSRTETNDPDFDSLVACFRERRPDCVAMVSSDLQLRTGSFTVLRPATLPSADIGLPRRELLVVVNYDPGVVVADYSQDLLLLFLMSMAASGALMLPLWLLLSSQLIPRFASASSTDGLTRLSNRTMFMEQVKALLADAESREEDHVFAVLDIDHFKRINDTFGHGCGDAALEHVAEILRTVTRPDDQVCRFGGEEFAILLNGSRETAGKALERLRLQLEMGRFNHRGHPLRLTASIGAAATADCGYNLDYLYNMADKALYAAKSGGRNRLAWSDGRVLTRLAR